MGSMDLLTIPGLDNSKSFERLRRESKERMSKSVKSQRVVAAMMTASAKKKRAK